MNRTKILPDQFLAYTVHDSEKKIRMAMTDAQRLGLKTGQRVLLQAHRISAVGVLYPTQHTTDVGKIGVDPMILRKLQIKEHDAVSVTVCPYPTAQNTLVFATSDTFENFTQDQITALKHAIKINYKGVPFLRGDIITHHLADLHRSVEFEVQEARDDVVLVIGDDTQIVFHCKVPTGNTVSMEDIGGLKHVKDKVQRMIILPIRHPELYSPFASIARPRGFIFHGQSGCGKTMMAKALVKELGVRCIEKSVADIYDKMSGESEKRIRQAFVDAKKSDDPVIIFFDDFDAMITRRDGYQTEVERRIASELSAQMDRLTSSDQVYVIVATTNVNTIDPAFRRSGRLSYEIAFDAPEERDRFEILQLRTRGIACDADLDLAAIASLTNGYVGADIEDLIFHAIQSAVGRYVDAHTITNAPIKPKDLQKIKISHQDVLDAMIVVKPSVMREFTVQVPKTTMREIAGLDDCKQAIEESVVWRFRPPEDLLVLGTECTNGILLYGPPGCGKTMLGQAVANEAGCNFFYIKGPEVLSMWVGNSERNIREIFAKAKRAQPAVIFIDEIDAIASQRGDKSHGGDAVTDRVVNQLLTELNGLEKTQNVIVIGATNRPDKLDSALIRTERFDSKIYVPPPNAEARKVMFRQYLANTRYSDNLDFDALAEITEGYSGSDIKVIVKKAGAKIIRERELNPSRTLCITYADLEYIITNKIAPSISHDVVKFYESFQTRMFGKLPSLTDRTDLYS